MNTPVSFELAKLLKEKRFDVVGLYFYSNPNSKMFGIDEQGRYYPIKNIPKKLYRFDEYVVQNNNNVFLAPTITEVVMWLYEKHGIWIMVKHLSTKNWMYDIQRGIFSTHAEDKFNSPTEAYEAAIKYTLTNLI